VNFVMEDLFPQAESLLVVTSTGLVTVVLSLECGGVPLGALADAEAPLGAESQGCHVDVSVHKALAAAAAALVCLEVVLPVLDRYQVQAA